MIPKPEIGTSFDPWAVLISHSMEFLWLLTVFSISLVFSTQNVMSYGYDVPKVTLYRTLAGLMAALWVIEWGLTQPPVRQQRQRIYWAGAKE